MVLRPRGPQPSRSWCFTWNNPGDRSPLLGDARYVISQLERGDSGTLHWQGYAEFNAPIRMAAAIATLAISTAHMERRRGTRDQARDYCRKDDTRVAGTTPLEQGVWRDSGQGNRTDLQAVADAIQEGVGLSQLAEAHPVAIIRYHHGIERLMAIVSPPPHRRMPKVFILYGPTDLGKSRAAAHIAGADAFWFPRPQNGHAYAAGYTGQRTIVFDDFYSWIPYDLLLRICDRYPLMFNVMGGAAPCLAEQIIFTSNQNPDRWYPNIPNKAAMYRRFTRVLHVDTATTPELLQAILEEPSPPYVPTSYPPVSNEFH